MGIDVVTLALAKGYTDEKIRDAATGGGVATAILRYSADAAVQNAESGISAQVFSRPTYIQIPVTCDNMTYSQALAVLQAGDPLAVMFNNGGTWLTAFMVTFTDGYISPSFVAGDGPISFYWNADGIFQK